MRTSERIVASTTVISIVISLLFSLMGCGSGGVAENDDAKRTRFAGISFVLPDGWTSTQSGNELEIKGPEGDKTIAQMSGSFSSVVAPAGKEEDALEAYLLSILETFDSGQFSGGIDESNISVRIIDGKTTETAKVNFELLTIPLEVHAFAAALDTGTVSLILGSSEGDYNDEFEGILDSVRIEADVDETAQAAAAEEAAKGDASFVGAWTLESMIDESGEETDASDLQTLKDMGLEVKLTLNENGTGALVLFGEATSGPWKALSSQSAEITLDGQIVAMTLANNELVLEQDGATLTFVKA